MAIMGKARIIGMGIAAALGAFASLTVGGGAMAASCATNAVLVASGWSYNSAAACVGPIAGNDLGKKGFAGDPAFGDAAWTLFGASDARGDGVWAENGDARGWWYVDFGDAEVSSFIVSLKAGNAHSLFLVRADAPASSFYGAFDTLLAGLGDEKGGKDDDKNRGRDDYSRGYHGQGYKPTHTIGKDLSHLSVFLAAPSDTPANGPINAAVPVPPSLPLFASALAGLALLNRSRRRARR